MGFKNEFGARLKELRKRKGLSQEKFSEMINIAQNTLSSIETGCHFCSAETIERIINALEIEPVELFNFGYKNSEYKLLDNITFTLKNNPGKIDEVWKIVKAITD
ncbi:helix-turn-helix transcriptional regulator [bacterium]|nr:helix-turn-helix transcriptional regulator [bacterium]